MNTKRYFKSVALVVALMVLAVPAFASGTREGPAATEEIRLTPPGTYPVSEELITIKAVIPGIPQVIDYNTNTFTLWMEEQTNIRMVFDQIPAASLDEVITLLLASGDYPEVFIKAGITPAQETRYGTDEGIFLSLNDLIEKEAPNVRDVLDMYDGLEGYISSTDGQIYSLPSINECYHCTLSDKLWINEYWLDKLGVETPTTIGEFRDAMIAIRDGDPNESGRADEIPITGATPDWFKLFPYLMSPFILQGDDPLTVIERNGKLIATFAQPEYREGLRWINELWEEGLIYEATFTQNRDQLRALAAQPEELLGSFTVGGLFGVLNPNEFPDRYRHYAALPPLEGPAGRQTAHYEDGAFGTGQFVITDAATSPEAAIRWIDLYYTQETELHGYYGEKDVHWRYADAGQVGITGDPAIYEVLVPFSQEPQNRNWFHHFFGTREFWFGEAMDPDLDPYTAAGLEKLLYWETKDKYEPFISSEYTIVPSLRFTAEELGRLGTLTVELESYVESSQVRFITGDLDVDRDWGAYVDGLNRIGLSAYMEALQRAFDRQYR